MPNPRHRHVIAVGAAILVATSGAALALVDGDVARCRSRIAVQVRNLADTVLARMVACHAQRMRGELPASTDCGDADGPSFPAQSAATIAAAVDALGSRVASACSAVTPAATGHDDCPSPCDAEVTTVASFADVAACLACQVENEAEAAIDEAYGGDPPVGVATAAAQCQSSAVGRKLKSYVRAVLQGRKVCQTREDAGSISGIDCASADVTGAIASAALRLARGIASCSDDDLALLTSCGTDVATEQACVRAAGDAMASDLFALVYRDLDGEGVGCAASSFLDVSGAPGAGPGYPAPVLEASCDEDEVIVQSNSIPPYTFVQTTPNPLVENDVTYRFPRAPAVAASTTALPLLGTIGVAVNGLPIFGPNEAAFPDPYGDPVANAILDECLGHTAFIYHYHALVTKCLTESGLVAEPWRNPDPSAGEPSPVIGYALDGFPIYGPYGCVDAACSSVVEHLSGWDNVAYESVGCTSSAQCSSGFTCAASMIDGARRQACVPTTYAWDNHEYHARSGSQYLDSCNGHTGPQGDYHYHATATFPYVLGCYRGTPRSAGL